MGNNKKINILVVDDIPASLLAFEAVLSELNENIVKATTGEAALAFLLKNECALIILDLQMNGMDGLQTAQLIRQNSRTESTPIIFTTTLHSDEVVLNAYSLGAVDYLIKPIPPEILRAKVQVFVELYRKNEELANYHQIEERLLLLSEASARLLSITENGALLPQVLEMITHYFQQQPRIKEIDIRVASMLADIVSAAITTAELYEEQRRSKSA